MKASAKPCSVQQGLVDHPSIGRPFLTSARRDMVATPALSMGDSRLEPSALPWVLDAIHPKADSLCSL
jgi:hypothetical protein